jgi:hypothetical protein
MSRVPTVLVECAHTLGENAGLWQRAYRRAVAGCERVPSASRSSVANKCRHFRAPMPIGMLRGRSYFRKRHKTKCLLNRLKSPDMSEAEHSDTSPTFASSSKTLSNAPASDVQEATFSDDRQHLSAAVGLRRLNPTMPVGDRRRAGSRGNALLGWPFVAATAAASRRPRQDRQCS